MLRVNRQYVRDLNQNPRRPQPPRDLVYDPDTGRLAWTGPVRGPKHTHYLVRIDHDSAPPQYMLPRRTMECQITFACTVIITCWNEAAHTESAPAYIICDPSLGGLQRRRSYPWAPRGVQPDNADPMFDETDWGFAIAQVGKAAADGAGIVEIVLAGRQIVNVFSAVAPPTINKYGSQVATGGTIPGSATYYIKVCSVDATGLLSEPSTMCVTAISAVTNTNTITVDIAQWPSGAVGYKLFAGNTPERLTWQKEASATPTSITITAYEICNAGIPDKEFRRYQVNEKRIIHCGCFGHDIDVVGTNTIEVTGAGWGVNQWAGHKCSVIGKNLPGNVELWNFTVSSNTADVLTMAPNPDTEGVAAGDVLVMRSLPVVGADGGGNYISDANWVNTLENSGLGLGVNAEAGLILHILSGPGRGYEYRIKSNTATKIYIDGDWVIAPTADSVYIITEVLWQTSKITEDLLNSEWAAVIQMTALISNEDNLPRLVQVLTINADGIEALHYLSPVREIYVYGELGESNAGAAEFFGFQLATCGEPLEVDETSNGFAPVLEDGDHYRWIICAGTESSSGDVVVDIQVSTDDGATWDSIFPSGDANKLVLTFGGPRAVWVDVFESAFESVETGNLLRPWVIDPGTDVENVTIKGEARRVVA